MKVTMIPIVTGALRTIPKGLMMRLKDLEITGWLVGWFVEFYGISTFVGYLTPNPFLCK